MEECEIKISRYNPEVDDKPILKEYKVPLKDQSTVLEALLYIYEEIDSTLFFNYGCRFRLCGKCAIKINGKPSLACETSLVNGMILEPLDNFPIIRDLGVDRSGLIEPIRKHHIILFPVRESTIAIQPSEFFHLIKCNECTSCLSTCPVYSQKVGYDGPFFGVKLAELYYDVRNEKKKLSYLESYLDKCIQCKQCDVVCPWEVNLSQIITKIKGRIFKQKKFSIRDWLISHPARIGYFISPLSTLFNTLIKKRSMRKIVDQLIGIDVRAPFPEYHPAKIRPSIERKGKTKHKVAYFVGCYNKFNDPNTSQEALVVLDANGVEVIPLDLGCCGMPSLGIGDLESAGKRAATLSAEIKKLILNGYDIVSNCPSCVTMIKIEYPSLFHLLEEEEVQGHIHDLGAYLWQLNQWGELNKNFKEIRRKVGYQVSCHLKAQKIGTPFVNLLRLIQGLEVRAIFDKCCGMAGTMGFKKEKYELSQKVGSSLMNELVNSQLDLILTDCASCQIKIKNETKINTSHPITIIKEAME
ncbi:MAG: anaerobic glycerol-3-phosphate dehydrogenase subunit C [Thermodesulfobacteriota bacterium]